jgi:L-seryl-tRNA(Ser) seleniumtransferase
MSQTQLLSKLPSVDRILKRTGVQELIERYSRSFILSTVDLFLGRLRTEIKEDRLTEAELETTLSQMKDRLLEVITDRLAPSLIGVVNATGVIVFTNAGRAPLAAEMASRLNEVATSYTNLEYDLHRGSRGHRDQHLEERIRRILDCEAATVCNNAAAAVFLILNSLSLGKKALVSRGELVEIGGSFRIPDIMARSGAILAEVGTTNKTRSSDYVEEIDADTALILRVHQSNYRIVGFTHRPALEELVGIAREQSIPLVHDIGSGCLFPTEYPCLKNEPTVEYSLKAGSDLICFSGDKLLGGPQAGIILGRKDLVERIRKNPLMRTFRVDKLTYAALDWTLIQYEQGTFQETLPVWKLISTEPDSIRDRALRIKEKLAPTSLTVSLIEGFSLTGGGSAPEEQIPTWVLAISSRQQSPNQLERRLRWNTIPILSRIEEDQVILDLRTVFPEQDALLLSALRELDES